MNEETGTLNKKNLDDLNDLYKTNKKFRVEIINFVRYKAGVCNESILDIRFNYNTLNNLGKETLGKFVCSIDYTTTLIEIVVSFKVRIVKFWPVINNGYRMFRL